MKKLFFPNKDYILGTISLKQKTVGEFCKEVGVERANFYKALNHGYEAPRSRIISKVAKALNLVEGLIWTEE